MFDLVQGGKSARVVNSVLALKSYCDWKQNGGNGVWKFGGNVKVTTTTKSFVRKNSEPFTNSLSRNSSITEKSLNGLSSDLDYNKMVGKLSTFVFVFDNTFVKFDKRMMLCFFMLNCSLILVPSVRLFEQCC